VCVNLDHNLDLDSKETRPDQYTSYQIDIRDNARQNLENVAKNVADSRPKATDSRARAADSRPGATDQNPKSLKNFYANAYKFCPFLDKIFHFFN
jgi:hypothetical protein